MPSPTASAYIIVLILWAIISVLKGRLHFKYVNYAAIKADKNISFIQAFGFEFAHLPDQRYMLPYPPKKDHEPCTEKEVFYRRTIKLMIILWVLWLLVLSPAVFVLMGGSAT